MFNGEQENSLKHWIMQSNLLCNFGHWPAYLQVSCMQYMEWRQQIIHKYVRLFTYIYIVHTKRDYAMKQNHLKLKNTF